MKIKEEIIFNQLLKSLKSSKHLFKALKSDEQYSTAHSNMVCLKSETLKTTEISGLLPLKGFIP